MSIQREAIDLFEGELAIVIVSLRSGLGWDWNWGLSKFEGQWGQRKRKNASISFFIEVGSESAFHWGPPTAVQIDDGFGCYWAPLTAAASHSPRGHRFRKFCWLGEIAWLRKEDMSGSPLWVKTMVYRERCSRRSHSLSYSTVIMAVGICRKGFKITNFSEHWMKIK
jgi:hypothetical protein